MPLTFPSHAAVVVPFWQGRAGRFLWPVPLMVGSATPDLAYALNWGGHLAHRWSTFLLFCVPVGLFVWFWLETLVLPGLTRSLGEWRGVRPGRLLQTRGLPRDARGWVWGAVAVGLGATTHLLWDGFTHYDQWPGTWLYPQTHWVLFGRAWYLANLLQYASSLVGLGVMGGVVARQYPRQPQVEPGQWSRLVWLAVACVAVGAVVLVFERHHFRGMNVTGVIWLGFWKWVGVCGLVLTWGCAWLLRERGAARAESRSL